MFNRLSLPRCSDVTIEWYVSSQENLAAAQAAEAAETEKLLEEEEMLTERDIDRLQADVDDLQHRFEYAVDAKHSLQKELSSMKERLKAASEMVEGCVLLMFFSQIRDVMMFIVAG